MDLNLVEIFLQSSLPGMMDCSTTFPFSSPMVMVTQWVYRPDVSPRSATESTRGLKIKLAKMCLESEDFFKDPEKKGKKDYLYFHDRACESAEKE